jgi:GTP-binding protein EngB required for normal cell division
MAPIEATRIRKMVLDSQQEQCWSAGLLGIASEIAARHKLSPLQPLIQSCQRLSERNELTLAVVGRFKAGKSSFLNHFLGRELLPVGVVPVTSAVTEIAYGPGEKVTVHFLSGEIQLVSFDEVRSFIAESENPSNRQGVSRVAIELPELAHFRALRFLDMPGFESTFAHNTETALRWLPGVDLALVAVGVDPPLSQHDVALIKTLYEYMPRVSVLLTKVDLLSESEHQEVRTFVKERLKEVFNPAPEIFSYSSRSGYEHLRAEIKVNLLEPLQLKLADQRSAVLDRKLATLCSECNDYLTFALRSAQSIESEREALRSQALGSKEIVDDLKAELQLIVQQTAAGTRGDIAKRLDSHRFELERRLVSELVSAFPDWNRSLALSLNSYETWLDRALAEQLAAISAAERRNLLAPLDKLKGQVFRRLQNFRDRLSEQAIRAFGVPLRTTEQEIHLREPHTPDIYVGRVFDRNWELLSPVLPMLLVGPLVRRHFVGKLPYMVDKNLSRLATQWDESIRATMTELVTEADRRIDELLATVGHLISTTVDDAVPIREDLLRLQSAQQSMPLPISVK